jgi:hypothetical protein
MFSISIFQVGYLIDLTIGIFKNRFSKFIFIKTLLKTKRRISFRGEFCLVKGKAFETGGENFKS